MYRVRQTMNGTLVINPRDRYLGRCLDQHGTFSPDEKALLEEIVRSDQHPVVVEVGANIGSLTVPMASVVTATGTRPVIYAFEPQRLLFQMLCANLVLNGLTNVFAHQKAAGSYPGLIRVPALDPEREQSFGSLSLDTTAAEGDPVEMVMIDALDLPRCTLIKVDVEGMESEVLRGAESTIHTYRPFLYLENDRLEKSAALIQQVFDLGYRAYWHFPILAPGVEGEFSRIVSTNMLCIPREASVALDLPEITDSAERPELRRAA